jgi:hypothetical protein
MNYLVQLAWFNSKLSYRHGIIARQSKTRAIDLAVVCVPEDTSASSAASILSNDPSRTLQSANMRGIAKQRDELAPF